MIEIQQNKTGQNKTGGKVIASGGFGCIFQPALKCKTRKNNTNDKRRISKLMTKKHAKSEYKEIVSFQSTLKKIPNYEDYFLLNDFTLCKPNNLTKSDLQDYKKKCKALNKKNITVKNVNKSLNKLLSLNMPYGGVDLKHIIKEKSYSYSFSKLNQGLIRLLRNGIVPMNNLGVYHCDIKEGNILIKNEGKYEMYMRLIDWGLSCKYNEKDNKRTIPKILTNRPFQYNVPFSIIFFNKIFIKEYHKFLKEKEKNKKVEPTYFDIREFVVNYISLWIKIRGPGHLKSMNEKMAKLVYTSLKNVEKKEINNVIIYDFTYYYIIEYLSKILETFTKNGKFLIHEYFSTVFIKNIDIWGFVMTYFAFFNKKTNNKIKQMIIHFLFKNPCKPIDVEQLLEQLENL